jgi:hypothetical protein
LIDLVFLKPFFAVAFACVAARGLAVKVFLRGYLDERELWGRVATMGMNIEAKQA